MLVGAGTRQINSRLTENGMRLMQRLVDHGRCSLQSRGRLQNRSYRVRAHCRPSPCGAPGLVDQDRGSTHVFESPGAENGRYVNRNLPARTTEFGQSYPGKCFRPQPESMGERVRLFRRLNGISQQELARQLGANETTVWRWEAGLRRPVRGFRRKLAALLGHDASELDHD